MNKIKEWYNKNFAELDQKNHEEFIKHIEISNNSKYDAYAVGKNVGVVYGVIIMVIIVELFLVLTK